MAELLNFLILTCAQTRSQTESDSMNWRIKLWNMHQTPSIAWFLTAFFCVQKENKVEMDFGKLQAGVDYNVNQRKAIYGYDNRMHKMLKHKSILCILLVHGW